MTKSILYGVYGTSGCGRGVAPLLEEEIEGEGNAKIVFIDDANQGTTNGLPVWSYEEFCRSGEEIKRVTIAIADSSIRRSLAEKCEADNLDFHTIKARQHIYMKQVDIGEGAIFSPFTTVTSNVKIGTHFHCNIGSYVEHDCILGDFVTFAPSVKCNGNVHIGDNAYIGAGAIIKQGTPEKPLRVGAGAIVGMGAVVTKDVAANTVVVGNPARPVEK